MWVDEHDVETQGGGVGAVRTDGVVVVLETEGHWLPLEDEGAADASADGDGPFLSGFDVPVGGDAGCGGEGPSFAEVVIDEVLPEEVVGLRFATESCIGESWVKSEPRTKGPGVARTTAETPPAQVPVFAG